MEIYQFQNLQQSKKIKNNSSKRKFGKSMDELYDSIYDLSHLLIEKIRNRIPTLDIDIYNLSAMTHTGNGTYNIIDKIKESRRNRHYIVFR
jgi:hypothetical protein